MFKKLLFASFCALSLIGFAQSYNLTVTNGTYTNLTGSTSVNNGNTWDDPNFSIPIGFNFNYFNTVSNEVYLDEEGLGGFLSFDTNSTVIGWLVAYGADIIDRGYDFNTGPSTGSLSNISYKLEGNVGSRILKIEWNNVGFYSDIDSAGVSTDYTNFQVWLFEGSNQMELRFGPNSISSPYVSFDGETGTLIGLIPSYDVNIGEITGPAYFLQGAPVSAVLTQFSAIDSIQFLNGVIPNGTIYRFTSTVVSIPEISRNVLDFYLFPNPVKNTLQINMNESEKVKQVRILNTTGQLVKTSNQTRIDVSELVEGIYFVEVSTDTGKVSARKFIKN